MQCVDVFWHRNYQIYSRIRCVYMVLANPMYVTACVSTCVHQRLCIINCGLSMQSDLGSVRGDAPIIKFVITYVCVCLFTYPSRGLAPHQT